MHKIQNIINLISSGVQRALPQPRLDSPKKAKEPKATSLAQGIEEKTIFQIHQAPLGNAVKASGISPDFPETKKQELDNYVKNFHSIITSKEVPRILLTTHAGPDGDGLSAILVLANIINKINPKAEIDLVIPDSVRSDRYNDLKRNSENGFAYQDIQTLRKETKLQDNYDLAITADVPNSSLIVRPELIQKINDAKNILQIDEHASGSQPLFKQPKDPNLSHKDNPSLEIKENLMYLHDTSALSSSHIVLKMLQSLENQGKVSGEPLLDKDLLNYIYYGISHDNQVIARGENLDIDNNPRHQLLQEIRNNLEKNGANVEGCDNSIHKLVTNPSPKEKALLDLVVPQTFKVKIGDYNIAISTLTQKQLGELNQETKSKLAEKFRPDSDEYVWTEAKGITGLLSKVNKDCDIQVLITETDSKYLEKGSPDMAMKTEYKVSLRINDEKAAYGRLDYLNVAELVKEIPLDEDRRRDAGGHVRASGAYYLTENLSGVISQVINILKQNTHKMYEADELRNNKNYLK